MQLDTGKDDQGHFDPVVENIQSCSVSLGVAVAEKLQRSVVEARAER